jgi:hypothetical protein
MTDGASSISTNTAGISSISSVALANSSVVVVEVLEELLREVVWEVELDKLVV